MGSFAHERGGKGEIRLVVIPLRPLPNLPPRYRLPLLLLGMAALLAGVFGGLLRAGLPLPGTVLGADASGHHGALMVAAFFGTVISLERAVALGSGLWYAAPLCAGLGGMAMLAGRAPHLPLLLAALLFCGASFVVWRRQRALFTFTLGLGALDWLLGTALWLAGELQGGLAHWALFLVLTIAGERLELTRLRPPQPHAARLFASLLVLLQAGAAWALASADLRPLATALLAMALWLARFDIAWVTVRGEGLPRFVAVCLLAGYAQLAFAAALGVAGALAVGHAWRDAALHALWLGFVFSMVIGHALIIFPAVMRVRIPYHPLVYLPLALLHTSLLVRYAGGFFESLTLRQAGSLGNALALAVLVMTILARVLAGVRQR